MVTAQSSIGIDNEGAYGEMHWNCGVAVARASTPMGSGGVGGTEQPTDQHFPQPQYHRGAIVRDLQTKAVSMLREPIAKPPPPRWAAAMVYI